ncbi:DUF4197 domain-containing protein [Paraflavisolibacter sp. H34]|uniref:DUF4197 domain-containing protein n=1 Tax=Huijunlia imazamoxiresistens TaxID=3127457 RepID=UPI0030176513
MKKILLFCSVLLIGSASLQAQGFKSIFKEATKKDSNVQSTVGKIFGAGSGKGLGLSNEDIVNGLKEALSVGAERGANKLSAADGFFKDAVLKILMPPEALKAEKTLRNLGMGKLVDNAILSMNRAAEDAAKSAAPIFVTAVKQMTFQDALGILKGGDFAATNYLKGKTSSPLTEAFRPVIESSLQKVNATKYWNDVFTAYNKFSINKVNPDLSGYVTEKAMAGIFYQLGLEEQKIRKDPVARTTDLLKKVFGNL